MPEPLDVGPLSIEELSLLRLIRLLDPVLRERIFAQALLVSCGNTVAEPLPLVDREWEQLESCILALWPAGWPGRQVVDLDNLGDPGAWLGDGPGEPWLRVLFTEADDERWASSLAESYGEKCIELAVPLPSEFSDKPLYGEVTSDDLTLFRAEFVGFLGAWRERILESAKSRVGRRKRSDDREGTDDCS